ncbi:MAG: diaminopimelate dehydrogenase [Ruminococcaceae bacterium]|nr:diaminopimelate dehydrogenase [Oscillospiraceae bacterium]
MNEKIRIAVLGYGNLGKGVELAIRQNPDMQLVAFFTRRDPQQLKTLSPAVPVYNVKDILNKRDDIDVLILCGGSATDLPTQSPEYAKYFNTVDSFDTHAKIPEHFENCDKSARESGHVAFISVGWDPGMFSLQRLLGNCILPDGNDYTFWGKGVSQGHSDAIRRIDGVQDAKQYTVPVAEAMEKVRNGENPVLTTREKHTRECFVVAKPDADKERIAAEIKSMPNYFADYDTTVHFISQEQLDRDHKGIPHGGFVMRSGVTGANGETKEMIEYSLKLGSNPEFTASVIVAYARAAYKMSKEGVTGAKTVFDVPPAYLSPKSSAELRKALL